MASAHKKSKSKKFRGIFNRYQKSKGLWKYIIEDVRCFFTLIFLFFRNGFKHRVLLVYPHYPSKRSSIYRIARELGFFLTNKLNERASIAVYWEYQTFREEYGPLESFCDAHKIPIVNRHSRDISKLYVDRAFAATFGYSTRIDPRTYEGLCVEKSDINAKHDGRVLRCPLAPAEIAPESEKIYQILIDNSVGIDLVQDMRIPIYGSKIPFVFIKYRPIGERFKNTTVKTEIFAPEELLSLEEIRLISSFAQSIRLDHGELDVLRDKNSKLIYIVDVNNTPQSPPAHTSAAIETKAVTSMSRAFADEFLKNRQL